MTGRSVRFSWAAGTGLVVVLVAVAVAGWVLLGRGSSTRPGTSSGSTSYSVVKVVRRNLAAGTTVPGTLGFGTASPIPVRASGTVTWLPPAGVIACQGDVLLKVDNRPVVLMYGDTPAYRAMDDGVPSAPAGGGPGGSGAGRGRHDSASAPAPNPSVGPDVEQFEKGLEALGYGGFTVDDTFTSGTAAAVRAWQEDLGVPVTGKVALGDVVFLPGPVRLRPNAADLGQAVSDTSVSQQRLTQIVTVASEGDLTDWARKGVRVRVILPTQHEAAGRVVAIAGGSGSPTISIRLVGRHSAVGPGQVEVTYVSAARRHVLTVPVVALVALAEGGYGVELESGKFVGVTPGLYSGGRVEVSGAITAGTRIRVPK